MLLGELNLKQLAETNFHTYAKRIKHCSPYDVFSIEPSTCVQLLQLEDGLLSSLTNLVIILVQASLSDNIDIAVLPKLEHAGVA